MPSSQTEVTYSLVLVGGDMKLLSEFRCIKTLMTFYQLYRCSLAAAAFKIDQILHTFYIRVEIITEEDKINSSRVLS